jgi:hypothetical protein
LDVKRLALCCACLVVGCGRSADQSTPEQRQQVEQRQAAYAFEKCAMEAKDAVQRQPHTHYDCVTPEPRQQAEQRAAADAQAECAKEGKVAERMAGFVNVVPPPSNYERERMAYSCHEPPNGAAKKPIQPENPIK